MAGDGQNGRLGSFAACRWPMQFRMLGVWALRLAVGSWPSVGGTAGQKCKWPACESVGQGGWCLAGQEALIGDV